MRPVLAGVVTALVGFGGAFPGALIVLAGLIRPLGRLIAAIPAPIAGAMLAGVLLPLCLAPVRAVAEEPLLAVPVVVVWVVVLRFARRWAVPAALAAATVGNRCHRPGARRRRPRTRARLDRAALRPGDAGGRRAPAVPRDDGVAERAGDGGAGDLRLPTRSSTL